MSDDGLAQLGEQLNSGDADVAEALFRAYAPYLRMVVRRQMTPKLRARFDSFDVVQSVWADTLLTKLREEGGVAWRFHDEPRLKSFLVRMTLNRFIDFYRRSRPALARETPISRHDERALTAPLADQPSEVAQAGELWDHMLAISPPAHHELLRLKTRGAPIAEIAARTGFHESSVRRILYDLADRLGADRVSPPPARNSAAPRRPAAPSLDGPSPGGL